MARRTSPRQLLGRRGPAQRSPGMQMRALVHVNAPWGFILVRGKAEPRAPTAWQPAVSGISLFSLPAPMFAFILFHTISGYLHLRS